MFLRILKKRLFYLILICFLTSCSSNTSKISQKATLRINLCDDPLSWDPRCVRLIKDVTLLSHLFEGITRRSKSDIIENGLAEKIVLSEDKKTYTIYLKEVFWSNGEPLTAQDFKSSWLQVLQPHFPSYYAHFMNIIKNGKKIKQQVLLEEDFGIKILSDKVFSVELEKPYPYFTELLSLPVFFPVHKSFREAFEEKNNSFPLISNGAFKLVHWKPQFNIKLEKNPYYWENAEITLKHIDISIIDDSSTELHLFEKKYLDWLGQPWSSSILPEARPILISNNQLNSYDVAGTFCLLINVETFPLDNTKLRQALSLALNKESIIKYILKGGQIAAASILPNSLSSLSQDLLNKQGNLLFASRLFEEALVELNLTREDFPKITLIYPSSIPRCSAIVQEIQQQWKNNLNFSIHLQGYEYRFFLEKRNQGAYQISTANWVADYSDPLSLLQILSNNILNQKSIHWKNQKFSELVNKANEEIDDKKRNQLIQIAEEFLLNELPILPLYHHSFDYALSENITGVVFHSSGVVNLKYINFIKNKNK